jgi:hypothetical protein
VHCRNWVSAQVWGEAAAGSYHNLVSWFRLGLSVGYGWNFFIILGYLYALALVGY